MAYYDDNFIPAKTTDYVPRQRVFDALTVWPP